MHKIKGYSRWLSELEEQITKYPNMLLNGIFGIKLEDSGVRQATQFRDFLLNYPEENTVDDLAQVVSALYVSNKEFPHGFGNTKELRKAIVIAFNTYFIQKNEAINVISYSKHTQVLIKRLQIMGTPALEQLNQYPKKDLLIFIALQSKFPLDLVNMIMQTWQAVENNCHRGPFQYLGMFKGAANLKHEVIKDAEDPELDDFVLMTKVCN